VYQLLGGAVRVSAPVYGWVGGDRPSDVLEQAKARKAQGFTRVKMNVRIRPLAHGTTAHLRRLQSLSLGWTRLTPLTRRSSD